MYDRNDFLRLVLRPSPWYRTSMNNRLAMCLVGPVHLSLGELKPFPHLWTRLVNHLRRLPEFISADEKVIFLEAPEWREFAVVVPGHQAEQVSGRWMVTVTLGNDRECYGLFGTRFQEGNVELEWSPDLPLGHFDTFQPLVEDLESFLRRLETSLKPFLAPTIEIPVRIQPLLLQ